MKVVFTFIFLMFAILNTNAQPTKTFTNKDTYSWMFGLSWVLTDDDGSSFNPFLVQNMHSHLFPTQVTVDKYFYNSWSGEAVLAYSVYNPGKITNEQEEISGSMFSMDFHSKYSFYKLLNRGAIDPFAIGGIGLSMRNNNDELAQPVSLTLNIGGGINFWVSNYIGIQIRSTAKIGVIDFFKKSDYMQHSLGIVARFESLEPGDNEFNKSKYKISKKRKKIKHIKKKKKKDDS
tara:strand:+ start:64 stop:762 length:699 start_codon:yes stop_codon:yes gene_type:complete